MSYVSKTAPAKFSVCAFRRDAKPLAADWIFHIPAGSGEGSCPSADGCLIVFINCHLGIYRKIYGIFELPEFLPNLVILEKFLMTQSPTAITLASSYKKNFLKLQN